MARKGPLCRLGFSPTCSPAKELFARSTASTESGATRETFILRTRSKINSNGSHMSIDKAGKWWIGTDADDVIEYLTVLTKKANPAMEFRIAQCNCGSQYFSLMIDSDEGAAARTCVDCGKTHFIGDSEECWEDASPRKWKCVSKCKSNSANVGVGFSMRDDRNDVRWIYIGTRCTNCGILGCYGDWKIDYSPSLHLLDNA